MQPMVWLGLGVLCGAACWPYWQPSSAACLLAVLTTGALVLCARRMPLLLLTWSMGGFWLGTLSCSLQPPSMPKTAAQHVIGQVVRSNRAWAHLQTAQGRIDLKINGTSLPVGRRIAARTTAWAPRAILPGARDPTRNDVRTGTIRRKLRNWVLMDGPAEATESNDPWQHAVHGGLLRSLATGKRDRIQPTVRERMRRTGTMHLLAISGLHVGLVAAGAWSIATCLLRPLVLLGSVWTHRLLAMGLGLMAAMAYAGAVGWPASAQRAVWMVGAVMIGHTLGRNVRPLNLLGTAATTMVLWSPGLIGDLGFQLSFCAVGGILLWAPSFGPIASKPGVQRWILTSVGATIGATIGTLPFAAWDFQLLAPATVLANLIATPTIGTIAVPAALMAQHADGTVRLMALAVGDAAIQLALSFLAIVDVTPWTPAVTGLGAVGLGACVLLRHRPLWATTLALWCLLQFTSTRDRLVVTFPAVGQGSAALVQWPDGRNWLIDGGPHARAVLHWLRRIGIRHLDTVFVSHPHPDHIRGLYSVIDELDVDRIVARQRPQQRGDFHDLWRRAAQRGTTLQTLDTPHPAIVHPPIDWEPPRKGRTNNQSLVVRLRHGAHSFLLTGDIEKEAERLLLPSVESVTVVQVPHHGSRTSSTLDFARRLRPRWAVIPVGIDNRYGHPAPEVLSRWGPARTLRTDIDGSIRFSSDGLNLAIERWTPQTGWQTVSRPPIPSATSSIDITRSRG